MAARGQRVVFLLTSLLLMFTRFGDACVSNPIVVILQSHEIKANQVLSKDLDHCQKDTLQINTTDPDFAVRLDGSLYATRDLYITGEQRTFDIWLQDSITTEKSITNVLLLFQPNPQSVVGRPARERRAAILRRQKRRWKPLPFTVTENSNGPFPQYVQTIKSEFEQNFTLLYKITGQGVTLPPLGLFSIKPESGKIYVLKPVDREEYQLFKLTGIARTKEGYYPEQPLDLTVKVIDENDNAPIFTEKTFNANVTEGSPVGTTVLKLTATDRDEPRSLNTLLRYKILSQMPVSKFSIDGGTGEIKTNNDKLDREGQDTYTLTVEVGDMNGASFGLFSTATVVVHVTDVNDNSPTFVSSKYVITVNESVSDIMVLRMPVNDKDLPNTKASRAVFTINKGNKNGNFKILTDPKTNEGLLYVVKPLDAEATPSIPLEIAVENEVPLIGSSSRQTASVIVNVKDVDEGPEFNPRVKQLWTKENVAIGTVLGSYTAKDPETKSSDGISYREQTDPANWVSIDQKTGSIKTTGIMDRESEFVKNNKYNVTVLAIENRVPPRTGTGTVVINLDDVNDNSPIIHNNHLHICENGVRQFVNVSAEDLDAKPNSDPFTFLLPDDPAEIKEKWSITRQIGSYAHIKPVEQLALGYYEVPIIVRDQQHQGNQQTLKILICECPNNLNCADRLASGSAVLGGLGILVMLLAALLLLCLLLAAVALYCGGDKKKVSLYPDTQYHQSIIVSNEEGGGQQDKNLAALDIPLSQKGNFAVSSGHLSNQETNFGPYSTFGHVEGMNSGTMVTTTGVGNTTSEGLYGHSGMINVHHTLHTQSSTGIANNANLLSRRNSHSLMDILRSQVEQVYDEEQLREQLMPTDYVHHYQHEGAESVNGSVGCCSDVRENPGLEYLNNLGPKFGPLANVSLKR
ncbi:desmocollin 2-like protein isoform X2 [Heterodontus francisci]|uniref:desmocollin 2-like protein isoform X2 n=1 Tax=Heterodontus francisci TaxID=7792 RepID=UPI00355C3768